MSLDAGVMCSCLRDGKAVPHPHPELLVLDECGYPDLRDWERRTAAEKAAHREWERIRCAHKSGFLVDERLGNINLIRFVRQVLISMADDEAPAKVFPILLERVIYNSTHVGDLISAKLSPPLAKELAIATERAATFPFHRERDRRTFERFLTSVRRLADASRQTGNPIVF